MNETFQSMLVQNCFLYHPLGTSSHESGGPYFSFDLSVISTVDPTSFRLNQVARVIDTHTHMQRHVHSLPAKITAG